MPITNIYVIFDAHVLLKTHRIRRRQSNPCDPYDRRYYVSVVISAAHVRLFLRRPGGAAVALVAGEIQCPPAVGPPARLLLKTMARGLHEGGPTVARP